MVLGVQMFVFVKTLEYSAPVKNEHILNRQDTWNTNSSCRTKGPDVHSPTAILSALYLSSLVPAYTARSQWIGDAFPSITANCFLSIRLWITSTASSSTVASQQFPTPSHPSTNLPASRPLASVPDRIPCPPRLRLSRPLYASLRRWMDG